jgi:endoglycosylceramidase
MPRLHVAHPSSGRAQIVDPGGRTRILRGTNLVGVEDDYYRTPTGAQPGPDPMWPIDPAAYNHTCPQMSHFAGEAPVCEVDAGRPEYAQSAAYNSRNDFAQMRALGIDFVRLGLSWSQLEPRPGAYSRRYLDRVAQVVGWAREQGVYMLLDMHQDAYSRFTPETAPVNASPLVGPSKESSAHADGAPPWAVIADNVPAEALRGTPELNLYVESAFQSFWENRVPADPQGKPLPAGAAPGAGLQDHYIGAMAALARRFKDEPTVAGYEIMNEPLPGSTPPGPFSTTELYPFYRRVIDALTGAGDGAPCPTGLPSIPACGYPDLGVHVRGQAFFYEPMAVRNVTDAPDQAAVPFSSYPGLVYAPHTYTHVFTADRLAGVPPSQSPYPTSYDQAFQVADAEARAMNSALLIGEYGNSATEDNTILRQETAAQDRALTGSTIYAWKGVCDAGASLASCFGGWSYFGGDPATPPAQNLALIPSRVKFLSRVVARAAAGRLDSFAYQPDNHSFQMHATADHPVRRGDTTRETVVFIPAAATGAVSVSGLAVVDRVVTEPDGTRLAYAAPTAAGAYSVAVGPS